MRGYRAYPGGLKSRACFYASPPASWYSVRMHWRSAERIGERAVIAPVQGRVGQTVTLEGYADDFGNQIDAIEVSLDGGRSWASFSTAESNAESMIHWTYSYTPEQAGIYEVSVRSVTRDGRRSPLAAATELHITE